MRLVLGLVLASLWWGQAWAEGPRHALVIAQGAYDDDIGRLDSTHRDAQIVEEALRSVGFEVTVHHDLGKDAIRDAVLDFAGELEDAGPGATGLFYYTGHGAALSEDSDNFLIPVNARLKRANDLSTEAYKLGDAVERLSLTGADHVFIVVDACRNVAFASASKAVTHKGFAPEPARAGMLIAYAAAPGETAAADNVFATALSNAIRTPGVEALPMFKRVRLDVLAATGGRQMPWTREAMTGDFFFAGAEEGEMIGQSKPLVLASNQQRAPELDDLPPIEAGPADTGALADALVQPAAADIAVTGWNVSELVTAGGAAALRFTLQIDGTWIEANVDIPDQRHRYTESARDESSVYLFDASRSVWLQFDVARKVVTYRDAELEAPVDWYTIDTVGASALTANWGPPAVSANAGVQPHTPDQHIGDTATRVFYAPGTGAPVGEFRQTAPGSWEQVSYAGGAALHRFRLEGTDEWSVYLIDDARGAYLQLDMYLNTVFYSGPDRGPLEALYTITGWE